MRYPCCPCCPRDDAGLCTEAENGSHEVPCTWCTKSDEIKRLRTELAEGKAKLVRVRELCLDYISVWQGDSITDVTRDILRAIEGEHA